MKESQGLNDSVKIIQKIPSNSKKVKYMKKKNSPSMKKQHMEKKIDWVELKLT